jgi:tRNA nucleotidyltransferase (CCA-adding enzyme)
VGGAVRDALLKRKKDYFDLDFVLPDQAIETAKKIADVYHAGFVVLDQQRQIARVVFKTGTLDFALQEGESLKKDLYRRDFTLNAIAYNPHTNTLIDPLNGVEDLKQGVLRMISAANLEDDPLRLLRAYRQAAQLNFTIDPLTRSTIRHLAALIGNVAAERVQAELRYLLHSDRGNDWLTCAWEDGLLQPWLKHTTEDKIKQLYQIKVSAQQLEAKFAPKLKFSAEEIALTKLACLVAAIPEEAELELNNLKYSRAEIRTVILALKYVSKLPYYAVNISLREQYFLFLEVKKVFPVLALLGTILQVNQEIIFPLMQRYLDPQDPVVYPQPLVTGNDLIRQLNLSPGPVIGKLLTELQIAQIERKIATVEEAIRFAQTYLI